MHKQPCIFIAALLALVACESERHIGWERTRVVIGPVPIKSGVAYVDSGRDAVVVVDVAGGAPSVHHHFIGRRALFATPTPDREHMAVITRGEEAVVKGQVDEEPHLWLLAVDRPDSEPVPYPLGSPFDRLSISGDGRVAVAYFSGAGADGEGFFRNPNELAVIHLDRPPGPDNPTLKTVRSFGAVPDGVVLSPPMIIPGAEDLTPRVFAFVLAPGNLTILDTTYPDRREVSIRLDVGQATVRPRELAFAPATATAYLRSDSARDVLEIVLAPDPPLGRDPSENDYRPFLAELGAGSGPADIAVYDDDSGQRLILAATPGTRQIVVIDADTAQFSAFPTPDPIDRILLFPHDPRVAPRVALLASIGAGLPRVHVMRLEHVRDDIARAEMMTVQLGEPVLDVVPVPGRALAMVVHDDDRTVLGLLDVTLGAVSPLQGVGRLDSYDFTPAGEFLVGATRNVTRVGFLDLGNLHPRDLRLDHTPARVLALPGGAVYVDHGDPMGRATIIPSPTATRQESVVLHGFLLVDLLQQEF